MMEEIKRYDMQAVYTGDDHGCLDYRIVESEQGEYVRYEDHLAAISDGIAESYKAGELAGHKAAVARYEEKIAAFPTGPWERYDPERHELGDEWLCIMPNGSVGRGWCGRSGWWKIDNTFTPDRPKMCAKINQLPE